MGRPALSDEAIRDNKIRIINAAREMVEEGGTQSISARTLGSRVGMNSALLYRYFNDIEEIILFACVSVLQDYTICMDDTVQHISASSEDDSYDADIYLLSWEHFCRHAFSRPDAYNMLFFSKHSSNLHYIIEEYYKLFPEEIGNDSDLVLRGMFRTHDLKSRNLLLLIPVLESTRSGNEIILINDMTVAFFYSLLSEMTRNIHGVNVESQTGRMLSACRLTIRRD